MENPNPGGRETRRWAEMKKIRGNYEIISFWKGNKKIDPKDEILQNTSHYYFVEEKGLLFQGEKEISFAFNLEIMNEYNSKLNNVLKINLKFIWVHKNRSLVAHSVPDNFEFL